MGIYVNQVGYLIHGKKVAVSTFPCNFQIIDAATQHCVYDGISGSPVMDESAGEEVCQIDFSAVTTPGNYYILAGNQEKSCQFSIAANTYQQLKKDLMKCLYYQRCGCELKEEHAGLYTHKACHTAPSVFLEDYMNQTPDPQTFDMTGGWHDAGDFGRYISPAGVTIGHLLYAYELFPESLQDALNIPETGNGMPDLLNECLYELKWMLKMQREDGGVYHKLTSFVHADFLMPEDDHLQFMIYPVSSMATADFAASMALSSRVYAPFMPEFAAEMKEAALKAWDWLTKNPYIGFHNPEGSNTGEYDDTDDTDERFWATAEMLRIDPENAEHYLPYLREYTASSISKTAFGWTDVSGLGTLSLLFDPAATCGQELISSYKKTLLQEADRLLEVMQASGYHLAMKAEEFVWGSNMLVCNRGILFILAALLSDETKAKAYQEAAFNQLHYLLGCNAMDVSYVTGHGEKAFKNPHNRPTAMDGIELPMPGWVSGGPFKTPVDPDAIRIIPAGSAPMKCYADHIGSYSTNEITIYWNSPAIFMTAYFESLEK